MSDFTTHGGRLTFSPYRSAGRAGVPETKRFMTARTCTITNPLSFLRSNLPLLVTDSASRRLAHTY
eukprot:2786341-Prymnesium_polylepis.1